MKRLWLISLFMLGVVSTGFAQHQAKVIALLNKASWCPVCKANGARFEQHILPIIQHNKDIVMGVDDLSNAKTHDMSLKNLKKLGIEQFARENQATGMLFLLDARTKQLINKVSLAESNEKIQHTIDEALSVASR